MSQILHAEKKTDYLRDVLERVKNGERVNNNEILAPVLSAVADKISGGKKFTRDQLLEVINKRFKFNARKSNVLSDGSFELQKAIHRWYGELLKLKLKDLLPPQLISVQLSDSDRLELIWVEPSALKVLRAYQKHNRRFMKSAR